MTSFVFSDDNDDYDLEKIKDSGRQARSQAGEDQGWVFVGFEHDEGRKKDSRRLVRSRATAYSHRVAPRGANRPESSLKVLRPQDEQRDANTQYVQPNESMNLSSPVNRNVDVRGRKRQRDSPDIPPLSDRSALCERRLANIARKRAILTRQRASSNDTIQSSASNRSLSPGSFDYALPDIGIMDASMRDPFETYPVRYRAWYGKLINFWYCNVFTRSTSVLKATRSELDAYTIWSRRQELQEPALFYCALYLASGIPVAEGLFPVSAALWLRYKTIEAMKDALADPDRALSDPVILAVGRIALHEHIYGSREAAHKVHRPAQLRMINMRGGLANMGLPATTVQLIVWTDALLSAEAGTTAYFADVPRQMAIRSYSPEEAIHVTNYCSPKRNAHPGYDNTGKALDPPD